MKSSNKTQGCLICQRIELIRQGINPSFVIELPSGFVVFGDHQFYSGYTLLLSKVHTSELHLQSQDLRTRFLTDMATVAEAVFNVFKPVKLNYELLGNKDRHLHWHIYPRYENDPDPERPIWSYPKEKRCNEDTKVSNKFIQMWQPVLRKEINRLIRKADV